MNLDDLDYLHSIDKGNMLAFVDALPDQFQNAWNLSQTLPLPDTSISQIVISGMGGSAIGGSLLAALVASTSPVPVQVVRGYDLPAYVRGSGTLLIASSHSGNTEETLAAAEQALSRGVKMLAITTGGQLKQHAETHGYPVWLFDYKSPPRAALGWSFGLLLGLAHRLKLASTLAQDIQEGIALLHEEKSHYTASSPLSSNPAKRGAGQLMGRLPVIYGAGLFEPVAQRWKCQFNENSKVWAQYEVLPEANHNTIVGIGFPEKMTVNMAALFITSPQFDHPRVRVRQKLTYRMCLENAIMADKFSPHGTSALAQMLHAIQYGDYMSVYAALGYEADPTEIAPINQIKELLLTEQAD